MAGYEPAPRIVPVPPGPSLLTSARPLPAVNWVSGIAWTPACQPSYSVEICPPAVNRTQAQSRTTVHTVPVTVYTPMICDSTGLQAGDSERGDIEQLVRDLTEAHTASALAATLWMGTGLPASDTTIPTLRRSGADVSDVGAMDLDDAVSLLLAYYELATGGLGGATLHLPAQLVTSALGGVPGGSRIMWPEGNLYRGPLGSVVSPGPGYPMGESNTGPDGNGPLIATGPERYAGNTAYQAWIYVSGPVEYAAAGVIAVPEDEYDRVPFRTNRYEMWGQRQAIVRFDPCATFGILVNNPAPFAEVS